MPLTAFLRLSRLRFLVGGLLGGAFGTAMAWYQSGRVDIGAYALAQATITSYQFMTHYANDYFDRRSDVTAVRTPYSGGSGTLIDGSLQPVVALRAALVCMGLGLLGTAALALAARRPDAAVAALAICAGAWVYSAPPLRLSARGLGELDTALVVAVLVPLCAFLAQNAVPGGRFVASVLPGAGAMLGMMLAVEYPDRGADAAAGKRTLVVRLGTRRTTPLGIACALGANAGFAAALTLGAPRLFGLAGLASLPFGIGLTRAYVACRDAEPRHAGRLAGRGVAFFAVVVFFGALAYAAAARLP
ncbi:MAG: prenyltransferase [Candidatus Eremiobacteraeota bacterium]|nr:prenyltransferase [Candidatus Eremiobacteraeota bacterium]MBC5821879.1 prenyltransferase [Candidatus Eremiobacteraeota bacterium]